MRRRELLVILVRIHQSQLNFLDTLTLLTIDTLPDVVCSKDLPITTSKANLSQTLHKLMDKGLIDTIPDRQDNRKKYIIITTKGKAYLAQITKEY